MRAALILTVPLGTVACHAPEPPESLDADPAPAALEHADFSPEEIRRILDLSPLPEPPDDPTNAVYRSEAAARLGQFLFFDLRLSGGGDVACATCHDPALGWGDAKPLASITETLARHSMTLWNVAYNRWFFWDGRADSLWAQALQPLEHPLEHGGSRLRFAHLVHDDPPLRRAYEGLFGPLPDLADAERFPVEGRPVPDEPDHPHARAWASMAPRDREAIDRVFANLAKAIASFERRILSRRSPFDDFVEGLREGDAHKQLSLSRRARRGLKLFLGKARCHLCHGGPAFTDREFHDNRVPPRGGGRRRDPGRYAGVERVVADPFNGLGPFSDAPGGAAEDKVGFLVRSGSTWSEFKTPGLRNVALTAPYMHRGQMETLEDVVRYYSTLEGAAATHHQTERTLVPVGLTPGEQADLVAFLESLTDVALPPARRRPPSTPYIPTH